LSHYHEAAYKLHFKKAPPYPFAIAILGHAHKINMPLLSIEPAVADDLEDEMNIEGLDVKNLTDIDDFE